MIFIRNIFSVSLLAILAACGGGNGDDAASTNTTETNPNGTLDTPQYTGTDREGFLYLNEMRQAYGVPAFKQSTVLDSVASQLLEDIERLEREADNSETITQIPSDTFENAARLGANYRGMTAGVLSYTADAPLGAVIAQQLYSVSGRMTLLTGLLHDFGTASRWFPLRTGQEAKTIALTMGATDQPAGRLANGYGIWPLENSRDQPWINPTNRVDPAPDLTAQGITPGLAISIALDDDERILVNSFTLNCRGQDVASRILISNGLPVGDANTLFIPFNWAFLLPEAPLPRGSTCTATFEGSGTLTGKIIKSWSFATASR